MKVSRFELRSIGFIKITSYIHHNKTINIILGTEE